MNKKKKPPGWKVRVGQCVGHGTFIGHFTNPEGFSFERDMHQSALKPNETFRELVVREAWAIKEQADHYRQQQEFEKANARASAEDDDEFFNAMNACNPINHHKTP